MGYLHDYLLYNDGNECPRNYHIWSALFTLACASGLKVYFDRGYFIVYPNLYICLVGKPGSRKSTAKGIAKELLSSQLPDIPISASVESKEAICQFLGSEDSKRQFFNEKKEQVTYHPYAIIINEMANFLNINPKGMIDFWVDIYDAKWFDVKTKGKGQDIVPNPCINILSCTTPDWFMDNLKEKLVAGGFARRFIIVFERRAKRIAQPKPSVEGLAAWERVKTHLRDVAGVTGGFTMSPDAQEWFNRWYEAQEAPEDPLLADFYESRDTLLIKVGMLYALCEQPFKLELTVEHLEFALALLTSVESSLPRLSEAAGRNPLAGLASKLLDLLESAGGLLPEKQVLKLMGRDLGLKEFYEVKSYLRQTDRMFEGDVEKDGVKRIYLMTKEHAVKIKMKGMK